MYTSQLSWTISLFHVYINKIELPKYMNECIFCVYYCQNSVCKGNLEYMNICIFTKKNVAVTSLNQSYLLVTLFTRNPYITISNKISMMTRVYIFF